MYRCCICDYNQIQGAPLLDRGPSSKIQVEYNELLKDFYCTPCVEEVLDNLSSITPEVDESDCSIQATVSK